MSPNLKIGKVKWAKGGREWLLLLLSLLLAFFIWFIHNLSLTYPAFLEYRVEVKSNIIGRSLTSTSDDVLIVRGKADGFYILKQRIQKRSLITLTVDSKKFHIKDKSNDIFYANSSDLKGDIIEAIGNDVDIEFIMTETLNFVFPKVTNKKIPVVPKYSISFYSQYMQVGDIVLKPDSVYIYGEEKVLNNIDSIITENFNLQQLREPTQGIVELKKFRNTKVSESQIYYSIDVERYIEESITINVKIINVPPNKEILLLPSELTLTYRTAFGSKKRFRSSDFLYVVDYNDYLRSINSKLVPQLIKKPKSVFATDISPKFVECLLINN